MEGTEPGLMGAVRLTHFHAWNRQLRVISLVIDRLAQLSKANGPCRTLAARS